MYKIIVERKCLFFGKNGVRCCINLTNLSKLFTIISFLITMLAMSKYPDGNYI